MHYVCIYVLKKTTPTLFNMAWIIAVARLTKLKGTGQPCTLYWNNVRDALGFKKKKKMGEMAPVIFHYSWHAFVKSISTISADKAISQTAPASS